MAATALKEMTATPMIFHSPEPCERDWFLEGDGDWVGGAVKEGCVAEAGCVGVGTGVRSGEDVLVVEWDVDARLVDEAECDVLLSFVFALSSELISPGSEIVFGCGWWVAIVVRWSPACSM